GGLTLYCLAARRGLANAAPRFAQGRGVEAAGETPIGGRNDEQVRFVPSGADEQRRRPRQTRHAAGERGEHALDPLSVGPRRLDLLYRAAQTRGGDHLHRRSDLLGRPDAADAVAQIFKAWHGESYRTADRSI